MADFTDRVKLVFDAVTGDATRDLSKLKGATTEAESGWGRLKGVAGSAIDKISASPAAMAGVGLAIGKVAFDLASGFSEAALSAQDFATASGLSVEQASRWQEVAGDLGVDTATLEGAVNKLNIAASKGALKEMGIGGADTNEQLLNAFTHLSGIKDASERASAGAKLFGKSWAQLAPLVEESGNLKDNLAAVSDAKVIDEGEVAKAREMRDAMDKLSDTLDDIKLSLGEALIGPITDVATTIGNVVDIANELKDVTGGVGDVFRLLPGAGIPDMLDGLSRATDFSSGWKNQLGGVGEALTANIPVIGGWASGLFGAGDAADDAAEATERAASAAKVHAQAASDAADAIAEQEQALKDLESATLASFNSQLGLANASDATTKAAGEYAKAFEAASAESFGNAEANQAAAKAQRDAESAALAQAAAADKLAKEQATANGVTYDAAASANVQADALRSVAGTLAADSPLRKSLEAYATQLENLPKTKTTTIDADTESAAQKIAALTQQIFAIAGKIFHVQVGATTPGAGSWSTAPAPSAGLTAAGGPQSVAAGVTAPQLVSGSPRAAGAGVVNNYITVMPNPLTSPAEIGRAIADNLDAFYRRSGNRVRAVA